MKINLRLAIVFCFVSTILISESKKEGVVDSILGKAFVKKENKWNPLKLGDSVGNGDSVKTGNASRVSISYEGSEYRLAPNTEVQLNDVFSEKKDAVVDVKQGLAWLKVENLKANSLKVKTPTFTAGVRGTKFATVYDPKLKNSMFCMCEGKVDVYKNEDEDSKKQIKTGSGASFTTGKSEFEVNDYKEKIKGTSSNPEFEKSVKEFPLLANCTSCHIAKGWTPKGAVADPVYGK